MKLSEIFDDQGFFATADESYYELVKWRDSLKQLLAKWRINDKKGRQAMCELQQKLLAGESVSITSEYDTTPTGEKFAKQIEALL